MRLLRRRPPAVARRAAAVVTVGVLASTALAACGAPDPEPTATKLAAGLSALKVDGVGIDGAEVAEVDAALGRITSGMDGITPKVSVKGVRSDDDRATATLAYRWALGPGVTWSYTTEAAMRRTDDRWTVRWSPDVFVPGLSEGQRIRRRVVAPERGDIMGGDGTALVTARAVQRIGLDKTALRPAQTDASARALATVVGIDPDAYAKKVAAAGPKAFVEAIVLRASEHAPNGDPEAVHGARVIADERPLGPTRTFAAAILGSVGPATDELVKESKGRLTDGDLTGLSGLQKRYDETLRGRNGYVVEVVGDAQDDPANPSPQMKPTPTFEAAPVPGKPLRTTLSERSQTAAERILAGVRPASALVAIRPSDGALLAAATGPGANGQAIATTGQYAPGSTFKIATALAALRAGVKPSDTVSCPATTVVDGKTFKNYDDYPTSSLGRVSFREAFAQSCNTAMIGLRGKVDQAALAQAAASLGMGVDHDLGFPSYFGSVPGTATSTEHAASMIGQGKVLASPFTMATVVASVRAGRTVVPVLLPDQPEQSVTSSLTSTEASSLRGLMRAVVTDGSGRSLASLGSDVGAKTGTAEYGSPVKTHAWMVATKGDLAVAVFVETGKSGSQTAGPLLKRYLEAAG